jgi:cyclophilin family peptidyl-prolyl cis-trans isomerase
VPSDKRERKRSKQERDLAYRAAAVRRRRRRGRFAMFVAMVATLGIGFISLLSFIQTDSDTEGDLAAGDTTSTTGFDAPCPRADGGSARRSSFRRPPKFCIDPSKDYKAKVETDIGTFVIDLDEEHAPETVNNFVFLARYHFYDGIPFHRVRPGFVIQGGNPPGEGVIGPGYMFADENVPKPPDVYQIGQALMAQERANTNGSQFLIVSGIQGTQLPLAFPLFGKVTDGMDVIAKIDADGGEDFTPKVPHTIIKMSILES